MLTWLTNLWRWISRLWKRKPDPPQIPLDVEAVLAPVLGGGSPPVTPLPFEPWKPLNMRPPRKHRSEMAYQRRQEKRRQAHITKNRSHPNV